MTSLLRSKALILSILTALMLVVGSALALEPGPDGWYHTGTAVRVKTVVLVDVNVYEIKHFMKKLPDAKTKQAVIDIDVDKKFTWVMKRDVDKEKIQEALRGAFKMNNYGDQKKIDAFIAAFSGELKNGAGVTIEYSAEAKKTTVTVRGGGTATIEGIDFMKGVWRIWFGNIDQPKLGAELISRL